MPSIWSDDSKIHVHIKNNRTGELVFRTTLERYAEAEARHQDIANRVEAFIDWDLDRFDESMQKAEVMMTWELPTENLRERAPHLKWVHIIGAGVEHLAPFDWVPPGLTITNNAGIHLEKTMDYVGMALQMLNNNIPKFVTDQRNARWDPIYSTPITGKTVAVIGVGKMGGGAARIARQLGCRVIGVRRDCRPSRNVDEMYGPDGLETALAQADFVIVNTPMTPETEGMLGKHQLEVMKPDAGLINLSRAGVVDNAALAEMLDAGLLSGAILDVHDPEPLPPDSPFWKTRNVILTPHVSSDDNDSYVPLTLDLLFENMRRFVAGKALKNRVDPKLGY